MGNARRAFGFLTRNSSLGELCILQYLEPLGNAH